MQIINGTGIPLTSKSSSEFQRHEIVEKEKALGHIASECRGKQKVKVVTQHQCYENHVLKKKQGEVSFVST